MKLKELIKKLLDYSLNAEVDVIAHCKKYKFILTYSNGEGIKKSNCKDVGFYVDELCTNEIKREIK